MIIEDAIPAIFFVSLLFYMYSRVGLWCFIAVALYLPIKYACVSFSKEHRKSLSNVSSYYINTSFYESQLIFVNYLVVEGVHVSKYSSTQTGKSLLCKCYHDSIVLTKVSLDDFIICVVNDNPSPAEIQKYMEPVLFIDGVEQPRPDYDDLKLSDEERRDLLREHHIEVARVVKKERDKFLRNLVTLQVNDTLQKTVNLMYKDEPDYDDIFDSLNEESYVLVKVSDINPKVIEVADWQPTTKDVDKYNVKSYLMLATVISKKSVDDNKQRKHSIIYYAKLRINDKMETSFIRVRGILKSDREEYESLKVGDQVMICLTEGKTKTVRVLDWQLTPADIEKYKTPVRVKEK